MELRHLRYFVAVAEELHFTRAAARLGISQPPLTVQIAALEAETGLSLLTRSKRRVELTDAGRIFFREAQAVLARAEEAVATAQRTQAGEVGELNIGFTPATAITLQFAGWIRAYRNQYPGIRLKLSELTSSRQIAELENRRLDLGFIRHLSSVAKTIRLWPVLRQRFMAVLPAEHRLANRTSVFIKELSGEQFVFFPADRGTGLRGEILALCATAGFRPKVIQEVVEVSAIAGLVAAGLGISILPDVVESIRMPGLIYLPIASKTAITTLYLARRTESDSALVRQFLEIIARKDVRSLSSRPRR